MNRRDFLTAMALAAGTATRPRGGTATAWRMLPSLPEPVANNAVAWWSATRGSGGTLFSFLGIDASLAQPGIHTRVFAWTPDAPDWEKRADAPGPGRLAATALAWRDRVVLLGGYSVQPDGKEVSENLVLLYDPVGDRYENGPQMPVPVDDSVSVLWRERYLYLISGWSHLGEGTPNGGNVSNVQLLDLETGSWTQASPIPAIPAFGHSGSISGNRIVCVDGVRVNENGSYSLINQVYYGDIVESEPADIRWSTAADHPGAPAYRAAAGTARDGSICLVGGTATPYNYNAGRYDRQGLVQPSAAVWVLDPVAMRWRKGPDKPTPSMDHRGAVPTPRGLAVVGGIGHDGRAATSVESLEV